MCAKCRGKYPHACFIRTFVTSDTTRRWFLRRCFALTLEQRFRILGCIPYTIMILFSSLDLRHFTHSQKLCRQDMTPTIMKGRRMHMQWRRQRATSRRCPGRNTSALAAEVDGPPVHREKSRCAGPFLHYKERIHLRKACNCKYTK